MLILEDLKEINDVIKELAEFIQNDKHLMQSELSSNKY